MERIMKNMPELRFEGFNEAWEQRKFSDLATMHARIGWQNLRTSEFLDSGDYLLVTGTDFIDGSINYDTCHYVEKTRYDQDKNIQIKDGSILITKDGTLGKVAFVKDLPCPATLNAGVFNVEVKNSEKISNKYLYQYLKAPFLMNYVDQKSTGGTIKHLNQNILVDFPVMLPTKGEQEKIGELFIGLDNLLTLHQRKCDELKTTKAALLQRMFPKEGETAPELRFEGFTEAWEQRKWKDCVDISTEMVDPRKKIYEYMPHIAPGNIESFTGQLYNNVKLVKDENLISGKFHFYKGDIIYGKINPQLGKYYLSKEEGLTSADSYVLNTKNGLVQNFLYTVLQTEDFYKYSVSVSRRSGMPKINRDELNAFSFLAPSEEEQKKISKIFLSLDNLLTLHQRKCEQLKTIKSALLQKMFV